jgi:hypothetical protein
VNRKSTAPIPEAILQLQRQFDQFRSTQPRRTKLPEPLWESAVELAREHMGSLFDFLFFRHRPWQVPAKLYMCALQIPSKSERVAPGMPANGAGPFWTRRDLCCCR